MDYTHLSSSQKVNHFRNHYELTRKDLLIQNVRKHQRKLLKEGRVLEAEQLDFIPKSFIFPQEFSLFQTHFKTLTEDSTWIVKPNGKAQGRGIFLI